MSRTWFPSRLAACVLIAATGTFATNAYAELPPGITFLGGSMTYLDTPPESVRLGDLTSDFNTWVFAEQQQVTLSRDVRAEITQPGTWFDDADEDASPGDLPYGTIPAGSVVDSYFFHFDNESYDFNLRGYLGCEGQIGVEGTISFDRPIIGVIITPRNMNRSGRQVALENTDYDDAPASPTFPGLNVANGCGSDRLILSDDRMTLIARNFTDIHHDNFRVLLGDPDDIVASGGLRR